MSLVNYFLQLANKHLNKRVLANLLFLAFKVKGKNISRVAYYEEFNAWEYKIEGVSYFSSGPGWAYSHSFLLQQLKKLSCFKYLPQQGDIILDVGAGVGEETIIFSELVGVAGRVYGIEAHPKTFGALSKMVNLNKLQNVIIEQVALSDVPGTINLSDSDNSLANSVLSSTKQTFTIKAITLDDFVDKHKIERIDLVKMNVEGAEQFIIRGMTKSISLVKNIAISCHDFLADAHGNEGFRTKEKVIQFLISNGFEVVTQRDGSNMVEDYVYGINSSISINGN